MSSTLYKEPSVLLQFMSFWRRAFLYGLGCQKVRPAVALGRWHKKIVQVAFVRWRGDSKIVEANAEHDFRLKRLIGMLRTKAKQVLRHKFFVPSAKRHCRIDLLTPQSYMVNKKSAHKSGLAILFYI